MESNLRSLANFWRLRAFLHRRLLHAQSHHDVSELKADNPLVLPRTRPWPVLDGAGTHAILFLPTHLLAVDPTVYDGQHELDLDRLLWILNRSHCHVLHGVLGALDPQRGAG